MVAHKGLYSHLAFLMPISTASDSSHASSSAVDRPADETTGDTGSSESTTAPCDCSICAYQAQLPPYPAFDAALHAHGLPPTNPPVLNLSASCLLLHQFNDPSRMWPSKLAALQRLHGLFSAPNSLNPVNDIPRHILIATILPDLDTAFFDSFLLPNLYIKFSTVDLDQRRRPFLIRCLSAGTSGPRVCLLIPKYFHGMPGQGKTAVTTEADPLASTTAKTVDAETDAIKISNDLPPSPRQPATPPLRTILGHVLHEMVHAFFFIAAGTTAVYAEDNYFLSGGHCRSWWQGASAVDQVVNMLVPIDDENAGNIDRKIHVVGDMNDACRCGFMFPGPPRSET